MNSHKPFNISAEKYGHINSESVSQLYMEGDKCFPKQNLSKFVTVKQKQTKYQPSELRSAFGNADLIADLAVTKVGKFLPTLFLS